MTKRVSKKFISILLALVSIMAVFSTCITANATAQVYNIDTSRKASLTLYKYEMADASTATAAGTGEMTDQTNVPSDAKPLPGVTFTIYKISALDNYFKPDGVSLPSSDEAKAMIKNNTPKYNAVTNASGIAEFKNLSLGIYYVEETNGPAQVTKKIAPFVLSLPLTDKTGSKWLYDVYSFPKNETAYGDVSVKKLDSATGSPLAGAEFTLYHSKDGETYSELKTGIKTGTNGVATVTALPSQMYYKFVETKTSDPSYILDSTVGYEFYVDGTGDMIIDDKAVENNTIEVGNDSPEIHKYILDTEKGAEGVDNTANYGDTVYWKIKTDVPSTVEKLTTYKVVDTMSEGLQYKDSEVYLDDNTKLTEGKDYTVKSEGLTVTYTFVPASLAGGNQVVIYFNTILTTSAPLAQDIPNKSKLIYTNDIGTESTYDKDSEEPTVHTGGYQFKKTDGSKALQGTTFVIYATEQDANNAQNVIETSTSDENGLVTFKGLAYGSFSADEEGKEANGVTGGSREYWIVETKATAGYSLISAPFKVVVNNKSHIASNNDEVVNNPLPILPKTGAMGVTSVLLIAGAMIVIGSVMIIRRRKSNNK